MEKLCTGVLREIGIEVNARVVADGEEWPDCFCVSKNIERELVDEFGVGREYVDVVEVCPVEEFRHYVVEVSGEVMEGWESAVVDASFAQFADETGTPVGVGCRDVVDDVVVVSPAAGYLFYR